MDVSDQLREEFQVSIGWEDCSTPESVWTLRGSNLGRPTRRFIDPGIPTLQLETKLRGLSPRANYTDRSTTTCRRS
jgi:hypothetical protein